MGENEEMSNFILSCCSTADLSKEHFEAIDVKYICFHYELDGVPYLDDLGQSIPFDEFYAKMAAGAETKTSQINADEFADYFRPFLEQGLDVLHVCLSSGITGVILLILPKEYWKKSFLIERFISLILWPLHPDMDLSWILWHS